MLLDPEKLAKRLRTKKFFESDEGRRFFIGARALARAYEQAEGDLGDLDRGVNTNLPTQKQIISSDDIINLFDFKDLELNKGGNPLIELKYGMGD
jgi:hypothetical protein